MAVAPAAQRGNEQTYYFPFSSTIATGATTEQLLFAADRSLRFRQVGVAALQTVTSGHPITNNFRAEFWNLSDATKLAQATITGVTSGTQLERGSFVSIATKAQFIGPGTDASAGKTFLIKFVGAASLNRGIVKPTVKIVAEWLD